MRRPRQGNKPPWRAIACRSSFVRAGRPASVYFSRTRSRLCLTVLGAIPRRRATICWVKALANRSLASGEAGWRARRCRGVFAGTPR